MVYAFADKGANRLANQKAQFRRHPIGRDTVNVFHVKHLMFNCFFAAVKAFFYDL